VITKDQRKMFDQVKEFVEKHQSKPNAKDRLTIVNTISARDRRFVQELADSLHLRTTWDEVDDYGQSLIVLCFDMEGLSVDGEGEGDAPDGEANDAVEEDGEWESEAGDAEGDLAIQRVFAKYQKAKVVDNTEEDFSREETMKQKMDDWKKTYYKVRAPTRLFVCADGR
jgi:5'-3' exoribonuclease 1